MKLKHLFCLLALVSTAACSRTVSFEDQTLEYCVQKALQAQEPAYKMAGPYEVIARDGQYRTSKGGSERDMRAAWDFALAGKDAVP